MSKSALDAMRRIDTLLPDLTVRLLDDFLRLFDLASRYLGQTWLYRGVSDETHELVPKVGRPDRKSKPGPNGKKAPMPYSLEHEKAALEHFRREGAFFASSLPSKPESQLEWLAVAQHYGAPTRLLDWTENFAVAAWFAICHGRQEKLIDGKRVQVWPAIWIVQNVPRVSARERNSIFRAGPVRSYRPPRLDGRMLNQQAVFTLHPNPTRAWKPLVARKVRIDPNLIFLLGKRLNSLGVNQMKMFPDLAGVGSHIAWLYRNNWLVGDGES